MLMLLLVTGTSSEAFSKLGEPGAEKTCYLQVALVSAAFMSMAEKLSNITIRERIASLCIAICTGFTKADVQQWGASSTFKHHARFAGAAGLDNWRTSIVRLGVVFAELVETGIELGDKVEEAVGRITTVLPPKLLCELGKDPTKTRLFSNNGLGKCTGKAL
ncbi:uncharacterized protein MEPE_04347 [Melanopsichium pennsylvanicum]|uniref:Uncharacterized protein n=1 Tax=Melanopsichium pennsylvanicum TaxID=63383 RepID=A0AAJ4XNY5_9BASI|nr:uncharacterized protein MEPE_04347 [Melanopsichium pennsylvanicum]